jgi:antitoxin (DNA-binding transcriptional repressor) of toxin-antitoxin stability system
MAEKNVSELLNIVRAGAVVTLEAHGLTADDILPVAAATAKADVPLKVRGALH